MTNHNHHCRQRNNPDGPRRRLNPQELRYRHRCHRKCTTDDHGQRGLPNNTHQPLNHGDPCSDSTHTSNRTLMICNCTIANNRMYTTCNRCNRRNRYNCCNTRSARTQIRTGNRNRTCNSNGNRNGNRCHH